MQTVTVEPIKNALTGRDFVCKRSARSSSPKCDIRCDIQGTGPSPEHFDNDLEEWKENPRVQHRPRVAICQFYHVDDLNLTVINLCVSNLLVSSCSLSRKYR